MNFKDLNYFVALAEKRSFSKAAEYCNASQPTISNYINRMERELGASLFNRSTRTLALTPKGEEILAYAKSILVSMSMIKHIAHTDDIINRSINLGITTSISHYLYTQVTNSLEAISEPTIKVHEIKKEEFKTQIDSGKMHCILSACDESYSQYEKILVAEFPYVLAVSKNDIIAKIEK
jgi:LysR family hydrogen peroxide-inducible transcriptional activator